MNWGEVLKSGLAVGFLAAVSWFVAYKLWPLIGELRVEIKEMRLEANKKTDDFLSAIERRDEIMAKSEKVVDNLVNYVREFREESRRNK